MHGVPEVTILLLSIIPATQGLINLAKPPSSVTTKNTIDLITALTIRLRQDSTHPRPSSLDPLWAPLVNRSRSQPAPGHPQTRVAMVPFRGRSAFCGRSSFRNRYGPQPGRYGTFFTEHDADQSYSDVDKSTPDDLEDPGREDSPNLDEVDSYHMDDTDGEEEHVYMSQIDPRPTAKPTSCSICHNQFASGNKLHEHIQIAHSSYPN